VVAAVKSQVKPVYRQSQVMIHPQTLLYLNPPILVQERFFNHPKFLVTQVKRIRKALAVAV
jgi:hypothetical protein